MSFPRLATFVGLCLLSSTELSAAQQLEVHFFEVGQGDATLVVGPDGTTFLFDAGPNGKGFNTVVPRLQALGIQHLDYVSASHYHADHLGGLDEVWQSGIQATVCFDRGDTNTPSTQSFNSYRSTYSAVRQTVLPGQVVSLGGGATATCLAVDGNLIGGTSININSSAQFENSASLAWRIEYGSFDLYIAGDLTGGGLGTTDVEGPLGPLCGDVDVMRCSHHGSETSSKLGFVQNLAPEAAIVSCGFSNQYGFPKQSTVNNLNRWDAVIPVWSTTEGTGGLGFVDAGGDILLTSDGSTWQLSGAGGLTLNAHCDELPPTPPAAGELVIAEFLRNPNMVSDASGEWLELTGARLGQAVSLMDIELMDASADFLRLRTSIQLHAGEEVLLAANGLPSGNGGVRPAIAWPAGTLSLTNASDSIELRRLGSSTPLDAVTWDSSWPGSSGASAERVNLLAPAVLSNFGEAISTFGLGDLGTPDADNDADTTDFGAEQPYITVTTQPTVGGILEMDWFMPGEFGHYYQGWVTLSTSPGVIVGGTHIPAAFDAGWDRTNKLPGWSGLVPVAEQVSPIATVPNQASLRGTVIYVIVVTLDLPDRIRNQSAPLAMFIL